MAQQECPERHKELVEETTLEGFSQAEQDRLLRLRRLVETGERSERYPVDKRQDFIRWLVGQGKLSDN